MANKVEGNIPLKVQNETVFRVMSIPFVRFLTEKAEDFLEILQLCSDRPPEMNNNFMEQNDFEYSALKNNLIEYPENKLSFVIVLLLIPVLWWFHFVHFLINFILNTAKRSPIEMEDISRFIKKIKISLADLRLNCLKWYGDEKKLAKDRLSEREWKFNVFRRFIYRRPSAAIFLRKFLEILNFPGLTTLPAGHDLKFTLTDGHHGEVETNQLSYGETLARRVSVTVQEIIFEEVED